MYLKMIRKVYICGAHSVGKTTLFGCLKKYLRVENAKLIHCLEVGRKICEQDNLTEDDLGDLEVLKKVFLQCVEQQLKQEDDLDANEANNNVLMVSDRCTIDYINYLKVIIEKALGEDLLKASDTLKDIQRLRQDSTFVFIIQPQPKFFESDGVRPQFAMTFNFALEVDEAIREMMTSLGIPFVRISVEDIQERFDFVVGKVFKRWPDLKRGEMNRISDDDRPKKCYPVQQNA